MSFVKVNQVVKRYGNKVSVDHLNLSIGQGEIFGLLGPNGAGKSTTINMIVGLLEPDQGEIQIDGLSIQKNPMEVYYRDG